MAKIDNLALEFAINGCNTCSYSRPCYDCLCLQKRLSSLLRNVRRNAIVEGIQVAAKKIVCPKHGEQCRGRHYDLAQSILDIDPSLVVEL